MLFYTENAPAVLRIGMLFDGEIVLKRFSGVLTNIHFSKQLIIVI